MATRKRLNMPAMSTMFWKVRLRYSAKTQETGLPSQSAEVSHGKIRPIQTKFVHFCLIIAKDSEFSYAAAVAVAAKGEN